MFYTCSWCIEKKEIYKFSLLTADEEAHYLCQQCLSPMLWRVFEKTESGEIELDYDAESRFSQYLPAVTQSNVLLKQRTYEFEKILIMNVFDDGFQVRTYLSCDTGDSINIELAGVGHKYEYVGEITKINAKDYNAASFFDVSIKLKDLLKKEEEDF